MVTLMAWLQPKWYPEDKKHDFVNPKENRLLQDFACSADNKLRLVGCAHKKHDFYWYWLASLPSFTI